MKMPATGVFLVTCSCSQHMTPDLFRDARWAKRQRMPRQLRTVTEEASRPTIRCIGPFPETQYLKAWSCRCCKGA